MVNLKDILAMEKPPKEDKAKIKAERRLKASKKFINLTNEERDKLYDLILGKFGLYELHMGCQKLNKDDFVVASKKFLKSYLFDLAMDIEVSIRQDWNVELNRSAEKAVPVSNTKEVINEAKLVERRYNDS